MIKQVKSTSEYTIIRKEDEPFVQWINRDMWETSDGFKFRTEAEALRREAYLKRLDKIKTFEMKDGLFSYEGKFYYLESEENFIDASRNHCGQIFVYRDTHTKIESEIAKMLTYPQWICIKGETCGDYPDEQYIHDYQDILESIGEVFNLFTYMSVISR